MRRKLPDRFYYQLNGKSLMENYIEQKEKMRETIKQRKEAQKQQAEEKKKQEKILKRLKISRVNREKLHGAARSVHTYLCPTLS